MSITAGAPARLRLTNRLAIEMKGLWSNRGLIWQLAVRDLGQRYRGANLGVLWSLITPLLMLAVYTFVFSFIFQARWSTANASTGEFAIILFAGLAAFNLFSEVTNRAPTIVLSVPNYVKKVVFPLEILPIVATLSAVLSSLITCVLVVIGNLLINGKLSATIIFLPVAYLPLVLFSMGLAWLLASLGVYIRDIGQFISVFVQILFFISPIFWSVDSAPEAIRDWLWLNPLTVILESFRRTLVLNEIIIWPEWLACTLLSTLIAVFGYWWFAKTKKGFADVL